MSRLDDYQTALLAAHPDTTTGDLASALDTRGPGLAQFVIDHGLGPLWHERTGRQEFHASRMQAEALFLAQDRALREIGAALDAAAIEHVVIKGAANRPLLYNNPAIRACFDLDILVLARDRLRAAEALTVGGFIARPERHNISREIVLTRSDADVDLHWGLLREGRLRADPTRDFVNRRRRVSGIWMPGSEDALFISLVHPAFAKHLAGWGMGLHRVADVLGLLRMQDFDRSEVVTMLRENGVAAAGWATLRWVGLLSGRQAPQLLRDMLHELQPGSAQQSWIDFWLRRDWPGRAARARWSRLFGFSLFLHDTPADALRAARGRWRARRRAGADLAAFESLLGE